MNSTCGAACSCSGIKAPIDRRRFITLSAYAAAATALAACAVTDGTTAPTTLNASIKVADFSALANVGGVATTNIDGSPIAIVRRRGR